jgi:hypothetical protein
MPFGEPVDAAIELDDANLPRFVAGERDQTRATGGAEPLKREALTGECAFRDFSRRVQRSGKEAAGLLRLNALRAGSGETRLDR